MSRWKKRRSFGSFLETKTSEFGSDLAHFLKTVPFGPGEQVAAAHGLFALCLMSPSNMVAVLSGESVDQPRDLGLGSP